MRLKTSSYIINLCLVLLVSWSYTSFAQSSVNDSTQAAAVMPEDLRSGKSLLIIRPLPDPRDNRLRGEWMPIADEAQPFMKLAGIDAVAAYHIDDIRSGPESERNFLNSFDERNITHLVIIEQQQNGYNVSVALFNKNTFIAADQPVWKTSAPDLSTALNQLYRASANSGQELKNLLILDKALPGKLLSPINGRRSEFYDLNLKSDKLAVLPFADTAMINEVMRAYPYKFEFVDPAESERDIRSDGFQFILYYVHSTGESVRDILGYETGESTYVSTYARDGEAYNASYSKDLPVYKFYIKHIYSGNVFLGRSYDAAPTWEQALSWYIDNLRKELMGN